MTLTLELTPDQEARLSKEAARLGVDARTYALRRLFSEETTGPARASLAERLGALGVLGSIEGAPTPDGRNRSEIEAACDPTR